VNEGAGASHDCNRDEEIGQAAEPEFGRAMSVLCVLVYIVITATGIHEYAYAR